MSHLMLCSTLILAVVASAQQQSQSVPGSNRPVSILISAIDSAGKAVRDLSKDQISVLDNQYQGKIADLRPVGDAPLSIGIMLLTSTKSFAKQQSAAVELVEKLLRSDQDRAFVITAAADLKHDKPWTKANLEWQSDREVLVNEIQALDRTTGIADEFSYVLDLAPKDTTLAFEAALRMIASDNRVARRVLVLFRSPWAHRTLVQVGYPYTQLRTAQTYRDGLLAQLISTTQQLHITIYTVEVDEDFFTPTSAQAAADISTSFDRNNGRQWILEQEKTLTSGRDNLQRLVDETGGRAWWSNKSSFSSAVEGIANELRGQYVLTFVPGANTPGTHQLKVSSTRGERITAQNVFVVRQPSPAEAKK
jgi:VWFA-related protein